MKDKAYSEMDQMQNKRRLGKAVIDACGVN